MWSSEQSRFKKQHLGLLAHDTIPSSIEKINQRRYLVLYCSHSQPRAPHKQKHARFSSTARAVETSQLGRRRRRIGGRRTVPSRWRPCFLTKDRVGRLAPCRCDAAEAEREAGNYGTEPRPGSPELMKRFARFQKGIPWPTSTTPSLEARTPPAVQPPPWRLRLNWHYWRKHYHGWAYFISKRESTWSSLVNGMLISHFQMIGMSLLIDKIVISLNSINRGFASARTSDLGG
jgi:hypothetical protein